MAGRQADELREIYQELTRPGGYNLPQANLQPSWCQRSSLRYTSGAPSAAASASSCGGRPAAAAPSLPAPCREEDAERCAPPGLSAACEKVFGKHQRTSTGGQNPPGASPLYAGLLDSRSVSTRPRTRFAPVRQQHNSGLATHTYSSDTTERKVPGADGIHATLAELFLPLPAEHRLTCWLCEAACEEPGWLNAPAMYVGAEEAPEVKDRLPPVTLLTLCSRCSAACALPAAAPHDEVLRKAGATRALLRRTEMFVQFLREYKQLLESLAGTAEKMTLGSATAHAGGAPPLLWDLSPDLHASVTQKLTDALTSALETDTLQSHRRQVPSLSPQERLLLERERAWLQRRLALMEPREQSPVRLLRTADALPSRLWGPSSAASPLPVATGSGAQPHSVSHGPRRSPQYDAKKLDAMLRLQSPSAKIEQGTRQQEPPNGVLHARETSLEALQQMVGRALTAQWQNLGDGTASTTTVTDRLAATYGEEDAQTLNSTMITPTANAAAGAAGSMHNDPENILLDYFEGRLDELPRFKLFSLGDGGGKSSSLQNFRNLPGTPKRPCDNPADASSHVVLAAADVAAAAAMDAGELLTQLREERRRRGAAEAALRESQQRIAALEKTTDHISGLALDLSHILGDHAVAMQRFVRTATQDCVEIVLQKSLLFSDEMAALMRQAQRRGCGVNTRPPRTHAREAVGVGREVPPPAPVSLQGAARAAPGAEPAPPALSRLLSLSLGLTPLVPSDISRRSG
ncbi:uncharacterized protein Tco025E_05941 [Trypanosoma conorhini]|uniref:Uncharacterized protein n=1 Tax=Trypanosoma conorhini TaxID=83891 RepID=A0A422P8R9_9TRYP|nr:uncharacterized protein Tco025E_05941 [Trypanosoma conorhini]RNF14107.1 hypothetical protein Tco025E_05941 [Trypanosoma conorhini]